MASGGKNYANVLFDVFFTCLVMLLLLFLMKNGIFHDVE